MYIWMVVAAFIAMLYSFTLSYRSDMRSVTISPRAESTIDKIVLQHRALVEFAEDRIFYSTGTRSVTFVPGEVNLTDLREYLPYGFNSGKIDADYISAIYCMDRRSDAFSEPLECPSPQAVAYAVTYGCIDRRWQSLSGGKPNNDLVVAMKKVIRSGTSFGHAIEADPNDPRNIYMRSTMAIQGTLNTWWAIPQYIIDGDNGMGNRSFSSVCVSDGRECEYCLIYMTPIY